MSFDGCYHGALRNVLPLRCCSRGSGAVGELQVRGGGNDGGWCRDWFVFSSEVL